MTKETPSTPTRGVIYAATGEAYLETARRSARSMRKHNPDLHITLFSDIVDTSGAFDQTKRLTEAHTRSKVDAICKTPTMKRFIWIAIQSFAPISPICSLFWSALISPSQAW